MNKIDRTGEVRLNNQGLKTTIIRYGKNDDIDIKFEDGSILFNKQYSNFKRGTYRCPVNRLGLVKLNTHGNEMKIIEYNGSLDITVEFQDDKKYTTKSMYKEFENGMIKNPYGKNIFNTGYFGIGIYSSKNNSRIYNTWKSMLSRCYNKADHRYHTYGGNGVTMFEEWHNFQKFAKWYENNYYQVKEEDMELDKDILYKNNKIYSPSTCVLVPARINKLFINSGNSENKLPRGVTLTKSKKYVVHMHKGHLGTARIGLYSDKYEAFEAYKNAKEEYIKQVANDYKDYIPEKLYLAMINYSIEITD